MSVKKIVLVILAFLVIFVLAILTIFYINWSSHTFAEGITLEKINDIGDKRYFEITYEELESFPNLKRLIATCETDYLCSSELPPEEMDDLAIFLENKKYEYNLFNISKDISDVGLDMSFRDREPMSPLLREEFEKNGVDISEYVTVLRNDVDIWTVLEKKFLFSLDDASVEELEMMRIRPIDEPGDPVTTERIVPRMVKNEFTIHYIYFPDTSILIRESENTWSLMADTDFYRIYKENGTMNVYTDETVIYKIERINNLLAVDSIAEDVIYKIGDRYYRFAMFLS